MSYKAAPKLKGIHKLPKEIKATPIKPELRALLEAFLVCEEYQPIFMGFAKHMGYEGDSMEEARQGLFSTTESGEIVFNVLEMNDLLLEFQIIHQLQDKEPFKTFLASDKKGITKLRELSKRILDGKEISDKDVADLFSDVADVEINAKDGEV